ncbi:MAG: hypothetical protein ACSHXW_05695 [Yoonia sp.]
MAGTIALFVKISKAIAGQIKIAKAAIYRGPLLCQWIEMRLKRHIISVDIAKLWEAIV